MLDIKLSEQTRCCQLRQRSIPRTQLLMSVTNMSITLECCGTETSALQSIFSVIRRRKNSEAVHGIHVRMAAIPSENGDFVRWRLVSIEGNQYERYDGFADTQALKVFPVDCKGSRSTSHRARTSQDYCNHGRHFACFHTNIDELIHAHTPRETEPDGIVVWLLFKAHSGARRAA